MLEKSVELSLSDVKTFVTNMFIKLFTFLGKKQIRQGDSDQIRKRLICSITSDSEL